MTLDMLSLIVSYCSTNVIRLDLFPYRNQLKGNQLGSLRLGSTLGTRLKTMYVSEPSPSPLFWPEPSLAYPHCWEMRS